MRFFLHAEGHATRIFFSFPLVALVLVCRVGDSQAQNLDFLLPYTNEGQQIESLKAAFHLAKANETKSEPRGEEPYYDLSIENVCARDSSVQTAVDNWMHHGDWKNQTLAYASDRLVEMRASVKFHSRWRSDLDRQIFEQANTYDAKPVVCENLKVWAIRSAKKTTVAVRVRIVNELNGKIKAAGSAAWSGVVAALKGNPLSWGTALTVGGPAVFNLLKPSTKQTDLEAKLEKAEEGQAAVDIGRNVTGASFFGNEQKEWITVTTTARAELIAFDYFPRRIIDQVNVVTIGAVWDDMLAAAGRAKNFCGALRGYLRSSLQRDDDAIRLALYALYRSDQGDHAGTNCLNNQDWEQLFQKNHVPKPTS